MCCCESCKCSIIVARSRCLRPTSSSLRSRKHKFVVDGSRMPKFKRFPHYIIIGLDKVRYRSIPNWLLHTSHPTAFCSWTESVPGIDDRSSTAGLIASHVEEVFPPGRPECSVSSLSILKQFSLNPNNYGFQRPPSVLSGSTTSFPLGPAGDFLRSRCCSVQVA